MNIRQAMAVQCRQAERFLLNYEAERRRYEEELAEFLTREKPEVGGGSRGGVGDPTGSLAVRRIEFERASKSFAWLEAVKSVEESVTDAERFIIRCRRDFLRLKVRKQGRPPWVEYVVGRFAAERDKSVGLSTVRNLWKNLLKLVVFAKQERTY